jgi:N-dimethylarginine dimethylaminohydrolase
MKAYINSEIGRLKSVLLGSVCSFRLHEPINSTQKHYYAIDPPRYLNLVQQQEQFVNVLKKFSVEIHWTDFRSDCPNQINTRDVATVLGNTLVVTSLKESIRKRETEALASLLSTLETPVIRVNEGIVEGGDIIIDESVLYVGMSERTDTAGVEWIDKNFSHSFTIIPIKLNSYLHLDVAFNLAPQKIAIIYPEGLHHSGINELSKKYRVFEITEQEQRFLATNILTLTPTDVVADSRNNRVNRFLREQGINVIELDFSEITKIGGSFRCATCPLIREPIANA